MAREHLLEHYQRELGLIVDLLTSSAQQAPISGALEQRLEGYLHALNTTGPQAFGERFEFESYRRFLSCIRVRLAGVGEASSGEPRYWTRRWLVYLPTSRRRNSSGIWRFCMPAWSRTADRDWLMR